MENKRHNEEVDIFELFRYIGKAFDKLGNLLLRFFNFLLRNIIIIGILILVGLIAGYFLDRNLPEKRKTVATVVSNFESAGYLYKNISEIESLLNNKNEDFLQKMGISETEASHLTLEAKPIEKTLEITPEEKTFFDILEDNEIMTDDEKKELMKRSYSYHEISLFHNESQDGRKYLEKIMEYLRKNSFYIELSKQRNQDIDRRINSNYYVLAQIDSLLGNYTQLIASGGEVGRNLIYSENSLNLAGLMNVRMELQEETTKLLTEKVENTAFLKVIDLGYPRDLEDVSVFGKKIVLIPFLLIVGFLLFSVFMVIRAKGKSLE
ncbi:MAG TPA: hypothetical protein VFM82_12345 [Flavobacteriaceae bacterium]|nr:hypothetical protein [Flavobacteriaceae bacterium]